MRIGLGLYLNAKGIGLNMTTYSVRGVCSLETFGAIGDGITSDQPAAIAAQAAIAAGNYKALAVGSASYLGTWGYQVPGGTDIGGQGHTSILQQAGATTPVLKMGAVNDITIRDLHILGDDVSTGDVTGVKMGILGTVDSGPQRVSLINVTVENCKDHGFLYCNSPKVYHQGPRFIGCVAIGAAYGFRITEFGEFAQLIGCEATNNTYGLYIGAGNITVIGGNYSNNYYNCYLAPGANDSHGMVSNAELNHAGGHAVYVDAITNGHTFDACSIYGAPITAVGNTAMVEFIGCRIGPTVITCTNGMLRFTGCEIQDYYAVTTAITGTGFVEFIDCRGVDATGLPANIQVLIQAPYTFSSDADKTLTAQQSVAETLLVAGGTITATRKITSYFGPASTRQQRIVNNNIHDVKYAWSTGTPVTIKSGHSALVGGDGTNAVLLDFSPVAPLDVYGVSPTSGFSTGATAITITGNGFAAGDTVTVGGSSATSVVVVSATTITCTTPSGTTGAKDVVVTDGTQVGTLTGGFTYALAEWNGQTPLVDWDMSAAVVTTASDIDSVPNAGVGGSALTGVTSHKPQRVTSSTHFNSKQTAAMAKGGTVPRFTFTGLGIASGGPCTVYVVGISNSNDSNRYMMAIGDRLYCFNPSGAIRTALSTNSATVSSAKNPGLSNIIAFALSAGTQYLYVNSSTEEGHAASNGFTDGAGVLGNYSSPADGFCMDGEIARVLVFGSLHDATARGVVLAALKAKYGTV